MVLSRVDVQHRRGDVLKINPPPAYANLPLHQLVLLVEVLDELPAGRAGLGRAVSDPPLHAQEGLQLALIPQLAQALPVFAPRATARVEEREEPVQALPRHIAPAIDPAVYVDAPHKMTEKIAPGVEVNRRDGGDQPGYFVRMQGGETQAEDAPLACP